ncbi:MAG: DoxX family protein, partial [Candidatus Eremiobacteraeota bacterium]|nr:DoxX family protein [Candidatus Eremiobacteraeota bacterium]
IGAALVVCVMIGAILSHVTHGQAAMIAAPVVLLVLAIVLGTLRGWRGAPALSPAR